MSAEPASNTCAGLISGANVYLVLIALFGFRLLFNYSKWIFPKCEGPSRSQDGPKFHRAVLIAIGGGLLSLVTETLLRMVGMRLPEKRRPASFSRKSLKSVVRRDNGFGVPKSHTLDHSPIRLEV